MRGDNEIQILLDSMSKPQSEMIRLLREQIVLLKKKIQLLEGLLEQQRFLLDKGDAFCNELIDEGKRNEK